MLKVENVCKLFPGVQALNMVNIDFKEGEIHALLGENGAGKSTLIKIICGVYPPDEGKLLLDSQALKAKSYIEALKSGIAVVNQELQVLPGMTVAENIMLDKMAGFNRGGFINWRKVNKNAKKYLDMVDLDVRPTELMGTLSVAKKQMVEIAKALSSDSRILLLDEPTSSISESEAKKLFQILDELKKREIIIIFVTHKLEEVFQICDRVTVLRDGKLIDTKPIREVDKKALVRMMIGREEKFGSLINKNVKEEKVLEVSNLFKKGKSENISFHLRKGEILGFYGLVGSGRTETARIIIGLEKKESGDIYLNGEKIEPRSITDSLYRLKMAYITENRKEEGLLLMSSLLTNINITIWSKIASRFLRFINRRKEISSARSMIDKLDIKATSVNQVANTLSGGNQQKVSIAKWLIAECDLLIFDEPTVGIDVGAKEYIHDLIFNLANETGKSIILISSDMPEIIKVSNRLIIFHNKEIIGEIKDLNDYNNDYDVISKMIADCYIEAS